MRVPRRDRCLFVVLLFWAGMAASRAGESWLQFKYDSRHSGDVPGRSVSTPLGLIGAVPLTDAIFTAPVVAGGRVYVVDGSGVAFCIDIDTGASPLDVIWRYPTRGGRANSNNVSSPALAGGYLHFGTMAGYYYVLDASTGRVIKEIPCGGPIFSAPVVSGRRVYFATLGSRVYALEPDGTVCWTWDFVKERLGFAGDRWSGAAWVKHKGGRVGPGDQFCCSRDIAVHGKTIVVPAGGSIVWLEDTGTKATVRAIRDTGNATFGLSIGESGAVYRQWHRLDNRGRVEILTLDEGTVETGHVPGTETSARGTTSLGFSSVSLRGTEVYRCRPEEDFGLCRHGPGGERPLGGYPSIASPIILRDAAVYGGLDGRLCVVPLGGGSIWSFETAFGKAISAPVAVCDGRIYFGCDDGYLYVLGPGGKAPLPKKDLELWKIRSPLTSKLADPRYDWFTSWGNWANTNTNEQGIKPPFKLQWIRRYEGSAKHFSTCGGGRLYTHTAEGHVFAVEQETGRLLWRAFYPGVHVSYTSPLYHKGRILVPQAGFAQCRLRYLDAATGRLIWEAPFAGSPSWNRQLPPIVHEDLAIYMFGSGRYGPYAPEGREERIGWLFGHQDNPRFPPSHRPLLRAHDLSTGKEVWTRDFSKYGSGGDDAGICLMDGTLFYSCYFGHSARNEEGERGPIGVTAALDPRSGEVRWLKTDHSIHGGCTISGESGRLYLGGYNKIKDRQSLLWCLDSRTGDLVWESDPVSQAIKVVTVGPRFLSTHSQYENGYLIDKETGKILTAALARAYKCTAFTLSEPYLLGSNMDVHDLTDLDRIRLLSSGPRLDPSECIGAIASNGRLFYTGQGGGLQAAQVWGEDAARFLRPGWTDAAP